MEMPLTEVVEYLKDRHGIDVQLDRPALEEAGIAPETPVSKRLKGISLKSVLKLMLDDLKLTYVVKNEVLLITTPDRASNDLETVVYPVGDLLSVDPETGEGDYDSLIELITSTIKPSSWDTRGRARLDRSIREGPGVGALADAARCTSRLRSCWRSCGRRPGPRARMTPRPPPRTAPARRPT